LVIIKPFEVRVFTEKAIIEPKRDGFCKILSNSEGGPQPGGVFTEGAGGFVVLVKDGGTDLGVAEWPPVQGVLPVVEVVVVGVKPDLRRLGESEPVLELLREFAVRCPISSNCRSLCAQTRAKSASP
jgi:hypothetical protein